MSEGPLPTVTSPVQLHLTSSEYHHSMPMHTEQQISPSNGPPRDPPPGGYGPPPPYGGGYHYPPYGPQYGPPGGGYYNYPPPPRYGGGGYGAPPAHYYGAYPYPSQHPNQPPSDSKRRKSPSRQMGKEKDKKSLMTSQLAEDIELERMRAAAEPIQVKPMRSDFHFFVDDMRDSIQAIAKKELRHEADVKMLLFTNMNARLMKAWEDATEETRAEYLVKEEDDRRRFMAEDEIVSRHCATLTARARSPRGKDGEDEEDDDEDDVYGGDEVKKRSPQKPLESPPKKSKSEDREESVDAMGAEQLTYSL
jgi:hypothetical protein